MSESSIEIEIKATIRHPLDKSKPTGRFVSAEEFEKIRHEKSYRKAYLEFLEEARKLDW